MHECWDRINHSEINETKEDVELYQFWFLPKKKGIMPKYEEKHFVLKDCFVLFVSPDGENSSLSIESDVKIYQRGFCQRRNI